MIVSLSVTPAVSTFTEVHFECLSGMCGTRWVVDRQVIDHFKRYKRNRKDMVPRKPRRAA